MQCWAFGVWGLGRSPSRQRIFSYIGTSFCICGGPLRAPLTRPPRIAGSAGAVVTPLNSRTESRRQLGFVGNWFHHTQVAYLMASAGRATELNWTELGPCYCLVLGFQTAAGCCDPVSLRCLLITPFAHI